MASFDDSLGYFHLKDYSIVGNEKLCKDKINFLFVSVLSAVSSGKNCHPGSLSKHSWAAEATISEKMLEK